MSEVIAALLIILLSIILIVIIWVIVKNLAVGDSEVAEVRTQFYQESIQITSIKFNEEGIKLSLQKTGRNMKIKTSTLVNEISEAPEGIDIISVVDLSGSMVSCNDVSRTCCQNNLGGGSYSSNNCYGLDMGLEDTCTSVCNGFWVDRLTPVKEANKELVTILSELEDSRIGIVAYSTGLVNSASIGLTNNVDDLNTIIDSWSSEGSTCICCGINQASDILEEQSLEGREKKIIVMSDGEANIVCPEQGTRNAARDAIQSSCDAREILENLIIYSVGAGENVNENTLRQIADCGGGIYFSALDIDELIGAYRNIINEIRSSYIFSSSNLDYLYVVFSNSTSSYRERIDDIPPNLVIRTYSFDLTGKLEGQIVKIEVYPVILLKSGKEEIGPLYDSWELVKN